MHAAINSYMTKQHIDPLINRITSNIYSTCGEFFKNQFISIIYLKIYFVIIIHQNTNIYRYIILLLCNIWNISYIYVYYCVTCVLTRMKTYLFCIRESLCNQMIMYAVHNIIDAVRTLCALHYTQCIRWYYVI